VLPPAAASPRAEANPLKSRLAFLRWRLRWVAAVRGTCLVAAVLLGGLLVVGLFDWLLHLPALVRALGLVGGLAGAGYLAYRTLFVPLGAPADDLSLALRIEERYPALNDCLASTVQFLQQPADSEELGSPSLRRAAVQRAMSRAQEYDFGRIIDGRGFWLSVAGAAAVGLVVAAIALVAPAKAWTAFDRVANPFGQTRWPGVTQLEVEKPRERIGRNEPFEVVARVRGVIPDKATVTFEFENQTPLQQTVDVVRAEGEPSGKLVAALKPAQVQRNFKVWVQANDAVSDRYAVTVLPPPVLVPLGGKASPQVRLTYPRYTDLPAADLPEGTGNVEGVAGTTATLRAAADRPLARAWIEYQPETKNLALATGAVAGGVTGWDRVPADLSADHRQLTVNFRPPVAGYYLLVIEDDTGLRSSRQFELRIFPDPAPTVKLDRPSATRDNLMMLPGADFTLQASADDPQYAVRSVFLEYRTEKAGRVRTLLLHNADPALAAARPYGAAVAGPLPLVAPAVAKVPQVAVSRRLSLRQFFHLDPWGDPLKEGDVLILNVAADDFDDVTPHKQPGRSHEVEIHLINRNALDLLLNQEQAKVQEELLLLRQQERDALKKVTDAETRWKKTGQLTPEDVDQLHQAEQLQQQIRERVGTTREEGLRARLERLQESMRDNHLPRSSANERLEAVEKDLNRLAREELEQVEQRLTEVRKQQEAPGDKTPAATKKEQERLTEARQHQEEVEKTLNDLLNRLEPWTSTREIKGEAKSLLQEQRQLNEEVQRLQQDKNFPDKLEEMKPQQKAELERLEQAQQKLAERASQLLDKMDRVAQDRKDKDPDTARELEKARQLGLQEDIPGQMREARDRLAQNKLNDAGKEQKQSAAKLEKLVKELEDKREAELDRLAKKLKQAEKDLAELIDKQEQLQKKVQEAAAIPDQEKREEALKALARQQKELQKKTEEMLKNLSRLRSDRAAQAMGKAGGDQDQAAQNLEQGKNAEQQQDDALDRLDEAQRELQKAREDAEEELAREQLAKVADQLQQLKDRQEAHAAEAARIQRELEQRKGWTRGLRASLIDLQRAQDGLAKEATTVAEKQLADATVFSRILQKAAKAMEQAAVRLGDRAEQAGTRPEDTTPDEETARLQLEAIKRLNQLLDAAKPEKDVALRPQGGGQNGGGGGGGGGGSGGGGGNPDGIPPLAQLKLLRALQSDVNARTEEFGKAHPDPKQLDDKAREQLAQIRKDQQEVADLLEEMTRPEGDKP
jgi:hypothetical protein